MAATSLVFATQPTKIDSIAIDAALREVHSGDVTVTEHPVEKGANISDHTRAMPDKLTMDCIVSNTPINRTQRTRVVESFGVQFVSSSLEDARQGSAGYAEAAYAKLVELKDAGMPITVVTQIRTYADMVITSLSVPRDSKTGDALLFSISFQRIIIVKNKFTPRVVSPKAPPKAKTGKQAPKAASEAQTKKSILYKLDESTGKGLSKLLTAPGG